MGVKNSLKTNIKQTNNAVLETCHKRDYDIKQTTKQQKTQILITTRT